MTKKAIGIDIGGTKIQIALVEEDGSIISNEMFFDSVKLINLLRSRK